MQIEGVRAVFGETYPDPVRVVSVGVEVEELLKNVKDEKWKEVSVEFCGGTHVQKTDDIKDLIILEESGIAKGIRRIIAVTGEDAHKVQFLAEEFNDRLTKLEKMPHGTEKDHEIKALKIELPQLSISAITKSKFRNRFAEVERDQLNKQKEHQKAESKKALDTVTEYFTKSENDKKHLIVQLPINANAKVVGEVLNHVKAKHKDRNVYLFAADKDEGKVVHGCHVSEVNVFSKSRARPFTNTAYSSFRTPSSKALLQATGQLPYAASSAAKQVAKGLQASAMALTRIRLMRH